MFDALFKPKFYSKCKSRLKLIKKRLESIRKRRKAVDKFLEEDIVDLLTNGFDYNAYGRQTAGLLGERNMSSCYELVAKFANCVSSHVGDLCKERDCPDECKEAIQSLIYAAARFSDLPELRELRTLFTEKFGNTLEPYICKEFVDKLSKVPPSKEMKFQLLHDIAQEFSIGWDSTALEQRVHSPRQLREKKTKHDPLNDHDDNNDVAAPKIYNLITGGKQRNEGNWQTSKGNESDTVSQGRKDINDAYWRVQSSTDNETASDKLSGRNACSSSLESVSENEAEIKRSFSFSKKLVPPPYVKDERNLKKPTESETLPEKESYHDVVSEKPIPRSVRRRPLKPRPDDNSVSDSKTGDIEKVLESEKVKACPMQQVEYHKEHKKQISSVSLVRGTSLPPKDTISMEAFHVHRRAIS
ncbi:unnamed protein product [Sphenostylis stenocarpa]|uniref:Uncharacterized protein n=1 Tax=Sphenostylis stenocarpa TaxID=92480 RepID=A0AA86SUV1_9FABA|nr:unnamed protein product [Sphenostylis stenocarpa]